MSIANSKTKPIEGMKVHKGRVWHGIVERRQTGGVNTWCNWTIMDSWAEYTDDVRRMKKICKKCEHNMNEVDENAN